MYITLNHTHSTKCQCIWIFVVSSNSLFKIWLLSKWEWETVSQCHTNDIIFFIIFYFCVQLPRECLCLCVCILVITNSLICFFRTCSTALFSNVGVVVAHLVWLLLLNMQIVCIAILTFLLLLPLMHCFVAWYFIPIVDVCFFSFVLESFSILLFLL